MDKVDKYKIDRYLEKNRNLKGFIRSFKDDMDLHLALCGINTIQMVGVVSMSYLSSSWISSLLAFGAIFLLWIGTSKVIRDDEDDFDSKELILSGFFTVLSMILVSVSFLSLIALSLILPIWLAIPISYIIGLLCSQFGMFSIIVYADARRSEELSVSELREERLNEILK
ncbi:MAG: hypothetical protein SLAVMIC_00231 [uncultured marine phage]|uniref:Uncharacterized protein n=1 Tax=uncultured marine phage TaxID=707152 RepID=A0A8D9CEU2_9VIRU|nr:MAG: hypothetical protein SLAVMIC_00231 [uncultured marine phage]